MLELLLFFQHSFLLLLMLFLSETFFSETSLTIGTKLGMNIPRGILHRTDVGIFDMAAITQA